MSADTIRDDEQKARKHREVDYPQCIRHAADLIGELRAYTQPVKREGHVRNAPGFKPTIPLAAGPVDDADDLYAALREHTAAVADMLGIRPPRTIGRTHAGEKGLPAGTTPEDAFAHARTLARFLDHQLHMIRDPHLQDDIQEDIGKRWARVSRKYPPTAAPLPIQARCINCSCLTIEQHSPRSFGDDETYVCSTCGRWHTEKEVLARRAAREREKKAKKRKAS